MGRTILLWQKLDEQIRTMKGYFEADCEAEGKLSLGLEVELL